MAYKENGNIIIGNGAGTFTTLTASGNVTFDTGTLFVDASADSVGFGTTSPIAPIHVQVAATGRAWSTNTGTVGVFENSGATRVVLVSGTSSIAAIDFADTDSATAAQARYSHAIDTFQLIKSGQDRFNVGPTETVVNEDSAGWDFRVESTNNTHMLFVDAGLDKLGVNTSTPAGKMEIIDASNQGLVIRSSKSASADTQSRLYGGAYTSNFSTIAFMNANATGNNLNIGGATTAAEPATRIDFWTGSVGSTGTGTRAMRINSIGNVGIGTSSPARPLHVEDVMRLEPRATAPGNASAGDIFFNSTTSKLQCYDGSVWQDCF